MIKVTDVGSGWKSVPWDAVFARRIVGDRLFLRSALIRKELLPLYAGSHMPLTYQKGWQDEALNPSGRDYDDGWVVKPTDSSNANGVAFAATVEEAWALVDAESRCYVIQRVVRSYLIDGHKFHARALLLLVGDLDGYVYDDARLLLAPLAAEEDDDHARITNRSFNKNHPLYDPDSHNRSLCDAADLDGVLRQIRTVVAALCSALADHGDACKRQRSEDDEKTPRLKRHFLALENTWELFGLDFMVDAGGTVVLLEANPEPSMDMWPNGVNSKADVLRGKCPVTDGVPRTAEDDARPGFTQVYSKRLARVLRTARARRRSAADNTVPPPPPSATVLGK
ncbi:hypothetical protein CTAYLR_007238 [Chrysophaeum taylorii]|uniref:Tubulin-tyrosine ligase n=1 Tax=Chrysophaeum taylorii TaxID=2483200 RepID=A0AAD7UBD5_9STRA|nr:hypothetical protein CTAYLR_007238 [Chrysophaeum taylorii]